jgi:hypothetical protein
MMRLHRSQRGPAQDSKSAPTTYQTEHGEEKVCNPSPREEAVVLTYSSGQDQEGSYLQG